ncbi:MAG TPA: hypothetical protein VF240_07930 [Pyrinomonadaceae bacterium]
MVEDVFHFKGHHLRATLLVLLLTVVLHAAACGGRKTGEGTTPAASAPTADAPALSDVEFAKDVFRRMAEGDPAVEPMLDWETLRMPGGDVAAEYNEIPGEANRAEFRKNFLKGFSTSFKASGGSAESAKNWREESKDGDRTQVATDSPTGNTLVFTVVRKDGRQKISELVAREKK